MATPRVVVLMRESETTDSSFPTLAAPGTDLLGLPRFGVPRAGRPRLPTEAW